MFINEFRVGTALNDMRNNIPNFCLTLGSFECQTDSTVSSLCNVSGNYMDYIALEKIAGDTFKKIIREKTANVIADILYQTLCALEYSQEKLEFVHYDLHADNIICVPSLPNSVFTYFLKDGDSIESFTMPAEYCSVIIDYGTSHVRGLTKIPMIGNNRQKYGMTPEKFYPHRDVFSLCMNIVFWLILFSRGRLLNENSRLSAILGGILLPYIGEVLDSNFFEKIKGYISQNPAPDQKSLLAFLNSLKKDGKYFLYLPENHKPSPDMHIMRILKKIKPLYPRGEGNWFWGNSERIGSYKDFPKDENKNELVKYISQYK